MNTDNTTAPAKTVNTADRTGLENEPGRKRSHRLVDKENHIGSNEVIAMIGPSGCGKSTFIRCLNRMNDTIDGCKVEGSIYLEGKNIYDKDVDVVPLRARVGMVFQKPNPFPKSIFDNVAYGPRIHGLVANQSQTEELVEKSLVRAGLWNEVKDRWTPLPRPSLKN